MLWKENERHYEYLPSSILKSIIISLFGSNPFQSSAYPLGVFLPRKRNTLLQVTLAGYHFMVLSKSWSELSLLSASLNCQFHMYDMYTHMIVHTYVGRCAHPCLCIWRQEVAVRCLFRGHCLDWTGWPRRAGNVPVSALPYLGIGMTGARAGYCCFFSDGDQNTGA